MASTQMNVRIDADIKRSGDAAFARAGHTPTDVVRKVWEFAARNEHDVDAIREALAVLDPPTDEDERQRKLGALQAFREEMGDWRRRIGIERSSDEVIPSIDVDYRELREEYWNEKHGC